MARLRCAAAEGSSGRIEFHCSAAARVLIVSDTRSSLALMLPLRLLCVAGNLRKQSRLSKYNIMYIRDGARCGSATCITAELRFAMCRFAILRDRARVNIGPPVASLSAKWADTLRQSGSRRLEFILFAR